MLSNLSKLYRKLPGAFAQALVADVDCAALASAMKKASCVSIVASGNSCYPASYLQLLLSRMDSMPVVIVQTPLEYIAHGPTHDHLCILVSYGAKNSDTQAVIGCCEQSGTELFMVTSTQAMSVPVVEGVVTRYGADHIMAVDIGMKEKGFVSILGTAGTFAVCHALATGLGFACSWQGDAPWLPEEVCFDEELRPEHENRMILHGPLGQPAALALAGFHTETLRPVVAYDLKNVTHGVWRTLKDTGPYTLYVLRDSRTAKLADFVLSKMGKDHQCIILESSSKLPWAVEPMALFAAALEAYGRACVTHRIKHPKWNPLYVNMKEHENSQGLISEFDLLEFRP